MEEASKKTHEVCKEPWSVVYHKAIDAQELCEKALEVFKVNVDQDPENPVVKGLQNILTECDQIIEHCERTMPYEFDVSVVYAGLLKEAIQNGTPVVLQTNYIWDSVPSIIVPDGDGYAVWYSGKCSMPLDLGIVTDVKLAGKEYDKQALETIKN